MSFTTSLRHRQKQELYSAALYLDGVDGVDKRRIPPAMVDPAYYRACALLCRERIEKAGSADCYSDLLEHSPAFATIARNLEYEQMIMNYRPELYPELDKVISRYEGKQAGKK
jgi:hypothetical protein